jgi:hypothetical protein
MAVTRNEKAGPRVSAPGHDTGEESPMQDESSAELPVIATCRACDRPASPSDSSEAGAWQIGVGKAARR